jgi:hypothetical protein
LLKKIEFHLLLADLALQLADARARPHQILGLEIGRSKSLARSTGRPQRIRATPAEMSAPLVKKAGRSPELAGQRSHACPRYHPLYHRKLELSVVDAPSSFGHRSLLENCLLFLCLSLGVHSNTSISSAACYFPVIYRGGLCCTRGPCGARYASVDESAHYAASPRANAAALRIAAMLAR